MYRKPPTYARKDLLTPGNYNQLAQNAAELEAAFRAEHIESSGEHNTPLIARTLGTVLRSGGAYSLQSFNADASLAGGAGVYNPAVGKVIVTLASDRYETNAGPIEAQNASESGDTRPTLTWARWFDDTRVEIYSTYWNGTLGVAGSGFWAAGGEDVSVHLGVHSKALGVGARTNFGAPLQARKGLRAGSGTTYANQLIQGGADLELALRVNHDAGAHNCREVSRSWAHVQWNGADWEIIDSEGSDILSVSKGASGRCDVEITNHSDPTYQVFIDVDYARLSGSTDDYFVCSAPADNRGDDTFNLFFYERLIDGSGVEYFDRGDEVDFHLWLFREAV